MHPFLDWLEDTGFSIWVRESGSIWSYPMLITFHAWGMALLVGLSALIDLRLLGFGPGLPLVPLRKRVPLIRFGFVLSLLSGLALTVGDAGTMLIAPLFYIKLVLIASALGVGYVIERRVLTLPELGADVLPPNGRAL